MTENNVQMTFDEFLQHNLTYHDYVHLDELMGESAHMTTKVKNNPSIGNLTHLTVIVRLLRKTTPEIKSTDLITRFEFGKDVMTEVEHQLADQI